MEHNFIKYIYESFNKLSELFNLQLKSESMNGQSYKIEYSSGIFVVKIEKYFREFYVTVFKLNNLESEINLFNLLEYLKQGQSQVPKSEYFRNEKNIEECYKKQLNHISGVIYENYGLINDFFSDNDYGLKMARFEEYWKNKHPELYKKT